VTVTERLTIPPATPYTVPPINDTQPRLYALLAVEVAPGKIVYYHLELDHEPGACTIDMDREPTDTVSDDLFSQQFYGPWHINATVSGTVVSDRPAYRPPNRTTAVQQPVLPGPDAYMVDINYTPGDDQ